MKKWLFSNKQNLLFIFKVFLLARIVIFVSEFFSYSIVKHLGFLGPTRWANLDGVHYLNIAQWGYSTFEQAFFPIFPLAVKIFAIFTRDYVFSGFIITYTSLFMSLFVFFKLVNLDFSKNVAKWSLVFLLLFPTSFFLFSIYTESLFLLFLFLSFYFARKENFLIAAVFAGLASGTRLVGIFILPAILIEFYLYARGKRINPFKLIYDSIFLSFVSMLGFASYSYYLWSRWADPLYFIHAFPAYGVGRSGGQIILLPQVMFRYFKIFTTVSPLTHDFLIAVLEISIFVLFVGVLLVNFRKIRLSYFVFSCLAILGPTLTGTLSSEPRYVLAGFPVFIILGGIGNKKIRIALVLCSTALLSVLAAYFLQGYFIA